MISCISVCSLSDLTDCEQNVELSSYCPCCGVHLSPDILYAASVENKETHNSNIFILNFCPSCNECFISKHSLDSKNGWVYSFVSASPMTHFQKFYSKSIEGLSPNFVSIYNESLRAEELGLTSICGMGYRKALEFLVKDYLIHKNPDKKEDISKKLLMPCINEYIHDERLKTLAKASAWIGNEETH